MLIKLIAATLCILSLCSCSGYHLGDRKPSELSAVQTISVPLFKNKTQEPRLATLVTNSMVDAITRDGTYQIAPSASSDADLVATIETITYRERRSSRYDSLRASALYVDVVVDWQLIDSNNVVLAKGSDKGRSQFSAGSNQQTSRNNAFPDAAQNAAEIILRRISNGF